MASGGLSRIPSRVPEPEAYAPRNRLEAGLIRWLNGYGVSVSFLPPGSYSSQADQAADTIKLKPEDGTSVLFHEATHFWLNRYGYRSGYRHSVPESLSGRSHAAEYRELERMLARIIDQEERLRPADRAALRSILGAAEADASPLSRPDREGSLIAARSSFIGNLVDESRTLGQPGEYGHPMFGFHEFFASTMTTLAFDGQRFFGALNRLERLSEGNPRVRRVYEATLELLRRVHDAGQGMSHDLRQSGIPDTARFERNIARLGQFLEMEAPRRERARL